MFDDDVNKTFYFGKRDPLMLKYEADKDKDQLFDVRGDYVFLLLPSEYEKREIYKESLIDDGTGRKAQKRKFVSA